MQAPGGVHQEEVKAPCLPGLGGVKGQGGGVGAFRPLDHGDPQALSPLGELALPAARKVSPAQRSTFLPRPW